MNVAIDFLLEVNDRERVDIALAVETVTNRFARGTALISRP